MTMGGMKTKQSLGTGAMAMDDEYRDYVHNVPESDPSRVGWLRQRSGDGHISWPASSRPYIQYNHIDGPLLHFRNGELHWLTFWERLMVWLGRADATSLEFKYRPHLNPAMH